MKTKLVNFLCAHLLVGCILLMSNVAFAQRSVLFIDEVNHYKKGQVKEGFWIYSVPYGFDLHTVYGTYQGYYKNNQKIGYWFQYAYNGFLRCRDQYLSDSSFLETEYYENNVVKSRGIKLFYNKESVNEVEDPITGKFKKKRIRETIVLKNGYWEYFWPNGKLKESGIYNKDVKADNWKIYDEITD